MQEPAVLVTTISVSYGQNAVSPWGKARGSFLLLCPEFKQTTVGRAKELTRKAHFVSSLNKRKMMGNNITALYTATGAEH